MSGQQTVGLRFGLQKPPGVSNHYSGKWWVGQRLRAGE